MYHRITPDKITELKENEVFVIGTNETGFHGAGSASFAFRFNPSGNWRNDEFFLKAMKSESMSNDRIGKWAIYGIAEGLMGGKLGKSYGIITIKKPGEKCSRSLVQIWKDIHNFLMFVKANPSYTFYLPEIGTNFAGWSVSDIASFFRDANTYENLYIPKRFAEWLEKTPPKQVN